MARQRRDAGYAFRARCPKCHGPLFLLQQGLAAPVYYCADHGCGEHGAGRVLTDAQVEHEVPVARAGEAEY